MNNHFVFKKGNPLTDIPNPQMVLYGFTSPFHNCHFESSSELMEFMKNGNTICGSVCTIEYLGKVADRSNVIRVTYQNQKSTLYSIVNLDCYETYNVSKSKKRGTYIWDHTQGDISKFYLPFQERGIIFEPDIQITNDHKSPKTLNKETL